MKRLVILTGAGVSEESGIATFRGSDGLWENHRVEDVASPEGWARNPAMVLEFYNQRRKQIRKAEPNAAHRAMAELEKHYLVHIITQNIDDLHERAGSSQVLHLHGEIKKAQSTVDEDIVINIENDLLDLGELCPKGSQLRPYIVWFGEAVPMMEEAIAIVKTADIFLVVGTGLQVYPAASLIDFVPDVCERYLIDPNDVFVPKFYRFNCIKQKAGAGMQVFKQMVI